MKYIISCSVPSLVLSAMYICRLFLVAWCTVGVHSAW